MENMGMNHQKRRAGLCRKKVNAIGLLLSIGIVSSSCGKMKSRLEVSTSGRTPSSVQKADQASLFCKAWSEPRQKFKLPEFMLQPGAMAFSAVEKESNRYLFVSNVTPRHPTTNSVFNSLDYSKVYLLDLKTNENRNDIDSDKIRALPIDFGLNPVPTDVESMTVASCNRTSYVVGMDADQASGSAVIWAAPEPSRTDLEGAEFWTKGNGDVLSKKALSLPISFRAELKSESGELPQNLGLRTLDVLQQDDECWLVMMSSPLNETSLSGKRA